MTDGNLSIAVAVGAGMLSFLSPCVLPLVPAYLGQLTAAAVVGRADDDPTGAVAAPSRWLAVRHAIAYVLGFGLVFTVPTAGSAYGANLGGLFGAIDRAGIDEHFRTRIRKALGPRSSGLAMLLRETDPAPLLERARVRPRG